jgi:hypothetical protein
MNFMKRGTIIGCIPNSNDFTHPQDRRRYIPYFKKNDILYEIADYEKDYEIIYISLNADLNKWAGYKNKQREKNKNVRVIFDLSDFYLVGGIISDCLRPFFHYLSGRTVKLRSSYKSTVMDMIAGTDVLICGSKEQKDLLKELHHNVIVVRDYFLDDIKLIKTNYELSDPNSINVLWEGLSHGNIEIFNMLKHILFDLPGFKVNLHFISDSEYCKIGGKYLCTSTYSILKEIFGDTDVNFHFYDWNKTTFSSIATACDIALIPIPENPFMRSKPENKLLLYWFLGLPVITSDTHSYTRVMKAIDENYICSNNEEWREKLINLASSKKAREKYMSSAAAYLKSNCSAEAIFNSYDTIFFG